MNKKLLLWIVVITSGFLLSTPARSAQSESPVACNEGAEPLSLVYGDHTTGCEVNPATDLDSFIFAGVAGEQIRITVLSETGGFDPRLELRDPLGVEIHDQFCNGNNQFGQPIICSFIVDKSLLVTGTNQIFISDQGTNEAGAYTLQLERIPPVNLNTEILDDIQIDDGIAPATDTDFFLLQANAGTDIRLTVLSQTGGFDPRLEVWGPDGVVVHDEFCNGNNQFGQPIICSFTVDLSLVLSGDYVVVLSDLGSNETGDYQIQTQCLSFPNCPLPAANAGCVIDVEQAVYIDGETVTLSTFRIANLTTSLLALELKVWLGVPGVSPIEVFNLGADGSFALDPGTDIELGPSPLLPVTAALPRGSYEFSCRLLDPVTGRLLLEDRNFFDIQ